LPAGAKAATAFTLSGYATVLASLGIVGEALACEELLLAGGEGEGCATVGTLQFSVSETHWMTSFLKICELNLVIQCRDEPCLEATLRWGNSKGVPGKLVTLIMPLDSVYGRSGRSASVLSRIFFDEIMCKWQLLGSEAVGWLVLCAGKDRFYYRVVNCIFVL